MIQPLDAITLQHVAAELDVKLGDGKVHKIQQPSHYELLLHLWVGGSAGRHKLYVTIRPELAFASLIEDTAFLVMPAKAPNFCMVLRKHLSVARLRRVQTLPDERVLNLWFDQYTELGNCVPRVLSLELMGRHSNMILYDPTDNLILGCAHGVSEAMSRKREISVGYPYIPPPRPGKPLLRHMSQEAFLTWLKSIRSDPAWSPETAAEQLTQQYAGFSRAVITDLLKSLPNPTAAYQALQDLIAGNRLAPAIHRTQEQYSLLPVHAEEYDWQPMGSISQLVAQYYLPKLQAGRALQLRRQLAQALDRQKQRTEKRLANLVYNAHEDATLLKRQADALMLAANQGQSQKEHRHVTTISLPDIETGESLDMAIDPACSLMENAQQYYRRYKKVQARLQRAGEQAAPLRKTLAYLQVLTEALARGETLADMNALREELEAQGWLSPLQKQIKSHRFGQSQPLQITSSDGLAMLVGRNNLQNDQLVGKLSRPEDWWLHAHQIPGSHVLIKAHRQGPVPDQTLLEAAGLAAYFSQARHSVNVPVIYTQCRYVRKIPDSYPGHVTYTHEQGIHVTPDQTWLTAHGL